MNGRFLASLRRVLAVGVLCLISVPALADNVLWYLQPAGYSINEGLPVGNGKLGGLIDGAPKVERVVLNEISLWTGDEKTATGGYDQMGSYQTLGILSVDTTARASTGAGKVPTVVCASGHQAYWPQESIEACVDGNIGTKWCLVTDGAPLIWDLRLPEALVVNQYSFTSGGDAPERDPSTWEFSGSVNGKDWTSLDRHENEPPFAKRCETKTFTCKNTTAFKFYRLTFAPKKGVMHFQVAEVAMPGVVFPVKPAPAAVKMDGYRRSLDLSTATHVVTYKEGDVTYRRETFASHPDEVMVMRLTADKPGACSGAVRLAGGHRETTQVAGNSLQFDGVLANNLKYQTRLLVLNEGGRVQEGEGAVFYSQCDSVTILLGAKTSYLPDHTKGWRGPHPHEGLTALMDKAAKKPGRRSTATGQAEAPPVKAAKKRGR